MLLFCLKMGEFFDFFDIYVLNLVATGSMLAVTLFRVWIELKNYRLIRGRLSGRKIMTQRAECSGVLSF